jgi:hypothetical protein
MGAIHDETVPDDAAGPSEEETLAEALTPDPGVDAAADSGVDAAPDPALDPAVDPALDPTGLVAELRRRVADVAPDDVVVLPRQDGFDVQYAEELRFRGTTRTVVSSYRARAQCDPTTMTYQILDSARSVGSGPGPTTWKVVHGRINEWRRVSVFGMRDDGTVGVVEERKQDTRVLHAAIRGPAAELGWTERQPLTARVGLVVGVIGGVGALVTVVALAVLALMGKFG